MPGGTSTQPRQMYQKKHSMAYSKHVFSKIKDKGTIAQKTR